MLSAASTDIKYLQTNEYFASSLAHHFRPAIYPQAGGIGVAISHIRASGSYIRGTNGHSNGLVPMLRNFNETARYVDQGGGKRKGSFAMYLGRRCLGLFRVDQGVFCKGDGFLLCFWLQIKFFQLLSPSFFQLESEVCSS